MKTPSSRLVSKTVILLGIDLGTSGIRATLVERPVAVKPALFPDPKQDRILLTQTVPLVVQNLGVAGNFVKPPGGLAKHKVSLQPAHSAVQNPTVWQTALLELLGHLRHRFPLVKVDGIICDATSSSVMLADLHGRLLTNALMYNDAQAHQAADWITQTIANNPQAQNTAAVGASSSLAKVLFLAQDLQKHSALQVVHQVDWLNDFFCGFLAQGHCFSDENNLLKLGYDPLSGTYPQWVRSLLTEHAANLQLPQVGKPGEVLMAVSASCQAQFGFSAHCQVMYGTTDSIAGFFAAGACHEKDAVISLGSTLAIKQLVAQPLYAPKFGLYSHKVKGLWLLGGASNGGGKVLLTYFSLPQIIWMDAFLQCLWDCAATPLMDEKFHPYSALANCRELGDFYALSTLGERFPIYDPAMSARLAEIPEIPLNTIEISVLSTQQFKQIKSTSELYIMLQRAFGDRVSTLLAHANLFASIVQGLVQIEKQAFTLLEHYQAGKEAMRANLYSVGGGTQNGYWQLLREAHLQNCLQSAFSLDAAYGVTRLATINLTKEQSR
ncbi:carbohydrate kinase [Thiosulfatimonas sediminis]|uniref:Carbohydrate kinase n=1 Tax=Thiosulfatimonas sediminis TaxID=2675054 RepID=A0A6F8PUY2_9GAMM|nr:hypothetical protein [Thiosulfatimonas sediminis]BBP45941.1 carbohydrate kinase [Thiosulfatimonas sediminis]